MFLFQLNTFLKDIEVRNNRSLDWRQTIHAEYNILNLWNLPKGLGLKVKIGSFSANAPQGQQLSLSEQMIQWPTIFSEVSYILCKCFVLLLLKQLCSLIYWWLTQVSLHLEYQYKITQTNFRILALDFPWFRSIEVYIVQ